MSLQSLSAEAAREAAIKTLERYWADPSGVVSFPVDPVHIARSMGAEVSTAELEAEIAGALVRDPSASGSPVRILLNRGDSLVRQRFTCAHELGHLAAAPDERSALGFVEYRDELSGLGTDAAEIFANRFAAELLMPGTAVRKWWADGFDLDKLASIFNVSRDAMQTRLVSLRLEK